MKKWLVGGVLFAGAAVAVGAFALRNPDALAGSVARRSRTIAPARADFCADEYCGHGGPGPKAGWCVDDYCGRTAPSTSH